LEDNISEVMYEDENKSFRIANISGKGSCLLATRDIAPLEIILADKPAVVAPNHSSQPVCLGCLKVHNGHLM